MLAISIDTALIVAIIGLTGSIIVAILNTAILAPRNARLEAERVREEATKQHSERLGQLRDALYSEMVHAYCMLKNVAAQAREAGKYKVPKEAIQLFACSDIYDFTRKDPVIFYQLSDAHAIDTFFREIKRAANWANLTQYTDGVPREDLLRFFNVVEGLIIHDEITLDFGLLNKFAGRRDAAMSLRN
jgi:hypothetical protein